MISSNSTLPIMKRNRNGISLFLKRKIAFFETENHWPYILGSRNTMYIHSSICTLMQSRCLRSTNLCPWKWVKPKALVRSFGLCQCHGTAGRCGAAETGRQNTSHIYFITALSCSCNAPVYMLLSSVNYSTQYKPLLRRVIVVIVLES